MVPIEGVENADEVARSTIRQMNEDFELMSAVEVSFKLTLPYPLECMIVFYSDSDVLQEVGRTEVQKPSQEISFLNTFRVTYSFEQQANYRCDAYEMKNSNHKSLFGQNNLGCGKFAIHEIVACPSKSITRSLPKGGTVSVYAEEMSKLQHKLKFVLGVECKKKGAGYYSIRVSRLANESSIPVYVTEGVEGLPCCKGYLAWAQFSISVNRFCNGESNRPALFELIRHDPAQKVLGSVRFNVEELKSQETIVKPFEGVKFIGSLRVIKFKYAKQATFLDYVYGGCEISLMIGIDFSKSNGILNSKKNYHGLTGDEPNDYILAIKTVGEILEYYDTDKLIPVYGFGAKLPPSQNVVSHCFALNGDIFNPEIKGISSVVEAYKKTVSEITFHGPSIFHDIIDEVIKYASGNEVTQESQRYFLLLVLTDGGISDLKTTVNSIVKASHLPISIIIIGIGNEDFDNMEVLDGDSAPLINQTTGQTMARDIVQFVPFAKQKSDLQELAKEVLTEVPDQVVEFMKSKKIRPNMPEAKVTIGNFGSWAKKGSMGMRSYERASSFVEVTSEIIEFYAKEKNEFIDMLVRLGFERKSIEYALRNGIACKSVELAIELINLESNSGLKKVIKDKKNEICRNCRINKINAFNAECGHLICCNECTAAFDRCTICRLFIFEWKHISET